MNRPRTRQLLDALSPEELRELEERTADSGRESLIRLLRFLMGSGEEKKEEMFGEVFKTPWSRDEDYLLRNELRLLNERIYDLIVRREGEEDGRKHPGRNDPMLLLGLLKRRAFGPFESLYKKFRENALNRHDYRVAHRLNEVWFEYLIHYREVDPDTMKEAHSVLMENIGLLKKSFRNEVAENQHRRVVCESNLLIMGIEVSKTEIGPDNDLTSYDTSFARYYDAVSKAHTTQGEERITHAFTALKEIEPIRTIFPERTAFAYAIVGSVLFAERRYSEAMQQFEEGIRFARGESLLPPLEMLFNYASTLMRLRKYREVLDLLDDYRKEFDARPKLRFRLECFRCFCYIFTGNPTKALEAIPPDIRQRPESEYNYFRFIYLILPYMNDDPETALREARNFLVYFNRNRKKLAFPKEKELAALYRHFYAVIYNRTDKEKQRGELGEVLRGIEQFLQEAPEYTDYLYVQWLKEEVEKKARQNAPIPL